MRILVAGGAGFIGSHLTRRLHRDGHEVLVVDNLLTGSRENLEDLYGKPRFQYLQLDICHRFEIPGSLDRIYNMASPASPKDFATLPFEILDVGSVGTKNLLDLAEAKEARILTASTSEVYGDPLVHPQKESYFGNVNPIGPRSVYDESKRFSEALLSAYRRAGRCETRIARIFNTYGPGMRLDDGRVLPNFACQALENKPLTIYGDGTQTRSFCYVSDLVEGLIRLMESDDPGPINLGNTGEITIAEFATKILELTGSESTLTFLPLPHADDPKLRRPDISRAKEVLDWEPKVPVEVGLGHALKDFAARMKTPIVRPNSRPAPASLSQAPLRPRPRFLQKPWGGKFLAEVYPPARPGDGEAWLASNLPGELGTEVEGVPLARILHGELPLVKLLDSTENLSIQVHPDDALAQEIHGPGHRGKWEAWYFLRAPSEGHVLAGLAEGVSIDAFFAQVRSGKNPEDLLHRVPVEAGDSLALPPGTIHSLTQGAVVLETQTPSNLTYRLYDYQRQDAQGQTRELHLEKGYRAACLAPPRPQVVPPTEFQGSSRPLAQGGRLRFEALEPARGPISLTPERTQENLVLVALDAGAEIRSRNGSWPAFQVPRGQCLVVPAGSGECLIGGRGRLLMTSLAPREEG